MHQDFFLCWCWQLMKVNQNIIQLLSYQRSCVPKPQLWSKVNLKFGCQGWPKGVFINLSIYAQFSHISQRGFPKHLSYILEITPWTRSTWNSSERLCVPKSHLWSKVNLKLRCHGLPSKLYLLTYQLKHNSHT